MKILRKRRLRKKGLAAAQKRKSDEIHPIVGVFEKGKAPRALVAILFGLLMISIIVLGRYYYEPRLSAGQKASGDIYASTRFVYSDIEKTSRLQGEAVGKIPTIYRLKDEDIRRDIQRIIQIITDYKGDQTGTDAERAGTAAAGIAEIVDDIDRERLIAFMKMPDAAEKLKALGEIISGFKDAHIFLEARITQAEQEEFDLISYRQFNALAKTRLEKSIGKVPGAARRMIVSIYYHFINPDNFFKGVYCQKDEETISKLREYAADSIPEQFSEVESGERILRRGAIVTPRHVAQLKVMAEAINRQMSLADRWLYVFGISLSTAFIIVLSAVYLRSYQPRVLLSTSRLILICSVALVSIALSKLFILLNVVSPFLRYPLFISFAALIISMVFGTRLGMVSAVVLSIFHGICYGNSLSFALTGMAGALGAAIWGRKVRRRADMIRVGAYVGITNFAAIICLGILDAVNWPEIVYQGMGGIAFGGLSTLLAAAVLPAIEYVFNIITNPSLVELSDSDHPLLKRMVMEIPGTYHHSLVVGNLAESASEAVRANPLLARVGSYFHDIGKLKKHGYFSENEEFGKSKHDTLIPSMSALIIISHVKEGIDLAREYKLNRAIIDIIKEHHGTSIVYYFYKRARELNNGSVHEKDFRYPGPKPQMRETAIIMLADSVEAASRSLETPSPARIGNLVSEIIQSNLSSGQLDECDLTMRDLSIIADTFTRLLVASLHPRVKYPKDEDEEAPKTQDIVNKQTEKPED